MPGKIHRYTVRGSHGECCSMQLHGKHMHLLLSTSKEPTSQKFEGAQRYQRRLLLCKKLKPIAHGRAQEMDGAVNARSMEQRFASCRRIRCSLPSVVRGGTKEIGP